MQIHMKCREYFQEKCYVYFNISYANIEVEYTEDYLFIYLLNLVF